MSVQPENATRRGRRRTPQRRLAAVVEERERKPLAFGWGADLTHRQKEAVKERIALIAGITLAVVIGLILAGGWFYDAVWQPHEQSVENNKEIAQVGTDVIRLGYFKSYEKFVQNNLNNQITSGQQQVQQIQADPKLAKKDAAQLSQLQAQVSQLQQQLGSLAQLSLDNLLNNFTVLQRASAVGVKPSPGAIENQLINTEKQAGGIHHFESALAQFGLTVDDYKQILTAEYLQQKVAAKVAKTVSKTQLEVRASHILVPTKKKALAERLYQEVLHGANFAALAKKYSTDPGSKTKGGDLGYFPHGAMVAPFDKAAFAMKIGQIRLVKSSYGWHIIKKTGQKRVALTPTQYQQAQQSAYASWLTRQQSILHVQRFVAVQNLPTVANPLGSQVSQPVNTAPQTIPQPSVKQPLPKTLPKSSKAPSTKKGTTKKP